MADVNPFEVPESCKGSGLPFRVVIDQSWYRVDGSILVCGSSVMLPRICFLTGTEVDLVARTSVALYPSLKIVLLSRQCTVHHWVSRSLARRLLFRWSAAIGSVILGAIAVIFGAPSAQNGTGGLIPVLGLLLIVAGLTLLMRPKPYLKLMRYEKPGHFFVRGFSQDFLDRLSKISATSEASRFPSGIVTALK